ncbi:acyltransferase [Streptomyces sp. NBC_01102]|uniref:acyltransferase family protein n=1 Tax=unclassified Streptomyces TaxID=2593676 RepID=UPI00386A7A61|nr:acyltransferase [Streptomyces sp. NBC_01102]
MTTDPRRPTGLSRLPSLTGLRFVAVLFVFAFHASLEAPFTNTGFGQGYADATANAGWLGVSFFFVLSGFVLTWSARTRDTTPGFWRRRAAKIYPLHIITWAAALVLLATAGTPAQLRQALPNLFLVHTWFPDRDVFSSLNDVSWSLSCEVFFYLLFPFLLRKARRIKADHLWMWAAVTALLVPALPLLSELLPDSPPLPFGSGSVWQFWFAYVLPVGRLLEFCFGIFLARMLLSGRTIPVPVLPAAALVVITYAISLQLPFLYGLTSVTVVPVGLLIAAVAQKDIRGAESVLAHPVAVRLGEWSFAFYLVHRLLLQHGHRLLGEGRTWSTPTVFGLFAAAFALSLLISWALHVCVERPAMRLLSQGRGKSAPRTGPSLPSPAAPPSSPETAPSRTA